jgi:hypothetical protein
MVSYAVSGYSAGIFFISIVCRYFVGKIFAVLEFDSLPQRGLNDL